MSLLLRNARFVTAAAARPFSSTSFVALKESDRHMPNQAEHNEKHKQDQLQKQKEGKGQWKPELASDSEEALNAERHSGHGSIEELQKKSAEQAQKKSG
ncbi:hypothetical protein MBM_09597 [Drepanopeziza brunnea f. sp. 'multigermtubi' MB_m1]|uniref:Mitochondrial carrier protein pet8 n=1 Tax=Marssonina brunnea f. sp. multigermtubi (strain MB_m1) TaxID=1072389 RepID=K1WHH2_MARBU|nr:uncharacterized protein MBM_09597 [Drepanopeziza brunnea f. sp. 'multigermtubi' MB_m1]EKD12276.1 hypothetical protein MBM_09597 [Drepanopeziza brunnea f. sp. 'multigermtubi' MB_m1]